MKENNLLEISGLRTVFAPKNGKEAALVDGIDLNIPKGSTVGLVGESGCGKSMTASSIMRLLNPPVSIAEGQILFQGIDLAKIPEKEMRSIRGQRISMIFQEPMTALNPSITVGKQVREAILLHERVSKRDAKERVLKIFHDVGIPEPELRYKSYPHQLPGGLRQRICIAMAMVLEPEFLIADEPTTALDVTVEAQILALMKELQSSHNMSILMITHNLGVVADICDEVNVMYAGQIVEHADKKELFHHAAHPYTKGLMKAIPRVRGDVEGDLFTIQGTVPTAGNMPAGCRFCERCPYATDRCRREIPPLTDLGNGHQVRCFQREVGT
ncbi:MAG: ABC transporter ATP-binding protein [Clostridiales bacterium]|nr:ABC transporter ATP-binding protein [Clostridiales bacterium]